MSRDRIRKILKLSGVVLLAIFAAIQFVGADRSNPPVVAEIEAPPAVDTILRRACWDCHSNETNWPWYSYVAPVSWWVVEHVEHGRSDLNFSDWPTFDLEAQEHALADIREEVAGGEMPLPSYTWIHRGARLSEQERMTLLEWTRSGR